MTLLLDRLPVVTCYCMLRRQSIVNWVFSPALSNLVQRMSIRAVLLGREFLPQATKENSCSGINPRVSRSPGRWP